MLLALEHGFVFEENSGSRQKVDLAGSYPFQERCTGT